MVRPEKCPECHQSLNGVDVRTKTPYSFSYTTGTYVQSQAETETVCGQCGADLSEIFYPKDVTTYKKALSPTEFRKRFNAEWETAPGMSKAEIKSFYERYLSSGKIFEDWIKEL
ncbi:MAG: hypothetical protein PHU43_03365 [Candidatus Bipolaricaulis sp.]|nr:hypothetical protein [Candidatus Bipolaricaulis sp.]